MAYLETRYIKTLKSEVKVLADIKIWYPNISLDLILTQFNDLIHILKASHNNYKGNIATKYYKMLKIGHFYEKFVEKLLEKLEQLII